MTRADVRQVVDGRFRLTVRREGREGEAAGESAGDGGELGRWDAYDVRRKRPVVVELAEHTQERAERAATIVAAYATVQPPQSVVVSDHGEWEVGERRLCYLVEAPTSYGTLAARLAAEGPVLPEVVGWGLDLVRGLAALHRAGVVHGSVHLDGVLLDGEGAAVLSAPGLTVAADATPDSDLYAFGQLLYALTTGRPPDEVSPEPAWRHASRVPQRLDHLLRELLDPVPGQRLRSAQELELRLREIAEGPLPVSAFASAAQNTQNTRNTQNAQNARQSASGATGGDGVRASRAARNEDAVRAGVRRARLREPGERPVVVQAGAVALVTAVAAGLLLSLATGLSALLVAGGTALVVAVAALVSLVVVEGQRGAQSKELYGALTLGGVLAWAVAAGVALPVPWWAAIVLVPLAGMAGAVASVVALSFMGAVPLRMAASWRYPLVSRSWMTASGVVMGVASGVVLGAGGQLSWPLAVVVALVVPWVYTLVLLPCLLPLRAQRS
ncbi:hypothetical protein MTQ01_16385 [Streptomyces sp. XM4193]|uniref:hypothetical protein n=1 Tax=Streptomyces sp. XM4193 TaxID=2929782 RepID=UPI001FF70122|nr:hypothetical protein [Streptomyces sp. XM4193]MCK1797576.1 hypothetical protein [Streptomyces sp. XM4193]